MNYEPKENWHKCRLCGANIKDLADKYGGKNIYYTQVFQNHLKKDHNIELESYFVDAPICKCGICNKKCRMAKKGANFRWREWSCGRFPGQQKWSKEAKVTRKGKGNPMFEKNPWNLGLTKETNLSIMGISLKATDRVVSSQTKEKQSNSAKRRLVHGHTGFKHSQENKEKSRQRTLKMIKDGKFNQTKTKPHLEMMKTLKKLKIKFRQEEIIDCWSFDFYLVEYNVYLEVDGDYFHSNPKIYPDGPKTNTQKINWYRDLKKNKYCEDKNLTLIRFWECDILNSPEKVKKELLCKLKK